MPSVPTSNQQAVRLRKEDGGQCEVLTREGVVRNHLWQVSGRFRDASTFSRLTSSPGCCLAGSIIASDSAMATLVARAMPPAASLGNYGMCVALLGLHEYGC